jgi:NTE family protein
MEEVSVEHDEQRIAAQQWPWARAPLFQGLAATDLDAIATRLSVRPFATGDVLITQGSWSGQLFILRTGIVQISVVAEAGPGEEERTVPLRRLVSGDCFGEMSLITGSAPSATVQALTDGEAWTLSQQDFLQLAMAHARLSYNINAILSERLLHTSRQQVSEAPPQAIVIVGERADLCRTLAQQVARLSRQPTLLVDGSGDAGAEHEFADLLVGLVHPPEPGRAMLVAASEKRLEADDLTAALRQLGGDYRYTLLLLPPGHPHLTPQLLAYATRVVALGSAHELPHLRAVLGALPLPDDRTARTDLNVVLTDAPTGMVPTVATLELLSSELGVPVQGILPASATALPPAIAKAARWLVGQRIGLVFGAGGAKGYAHLGVLRVLRRARIPLDYVAGTSIGAISGAGAAMNAPLARIEAAYASGPAHVIRPALPIYSIFSNRAVMRWMRSEEIYGDLQLEDLPIPFAISAADLTEGREIVLRRGPLWQAVLASAAIPAIYPPVQIGPHWLVDGGVVNPVPVATARLLGADIVIAIDLSERLGPRQEASLDGEPPRRPKLLDAILRSRDIMMSEIRQHTRGEPAILIKPEVRGVSLRNFSDGARYIEPGERAAEQALQRIYELLPWTATPTEAEPPYP